MTDSTQNGQRPRITIVGVQVEDYQGLEAAALNHVPGTGLVRVTGKNGSGKTSLLDSIRAALGGRAEVHERPVRDGAESATISIELSDGLRIVRRHTEANPKGALTVVGPDGGKYGQTKLDGMVGPLSFDLMTYFGLSPDRQRAILLSLASDPQLGEKLEALQTVEASIREERKPLISERQRIERTTKPDGKRPTPVSVTEEMARLGSLQADERAFQDAGRAVTRAAEGVEAAQVMVDSAEQEVARLEEELEQARAALEKRVTERRQANTQVSAAETALDALADPSEQITEVKNRLAEADAVNKAVEPWITWEADQEKLAILKAEIREMDERLDGVQADRRQSIADAGIPVPGVSFDAETGRPLLHGRDLELACGRERVEMAAAVAFAADPALGICLIDEGDVLDDDAQDALNTEAGVRGFQVWMASVGRNGPGDVMVENGHARSTAGPSLVTEPATAVQNGDGLGPDGQWPDLEF